MFTCLLVSASPGFFFSFGFVLIEDITLLPEIPRDAFDEYEKTNSNIEDKVAIEEFKCSVVSCNVQLVALQRISFQSTAYRVFHNCWNKAIGHKSRILNDTTMMITFIERW